MPVSEGGFVWYELMTRHPASARDFYTKVIGWQAADASMPGIDYTLLKVGEHGVAGLVGMPQGLDAPSRWMGYILTSDVDGMVQRVTPAGGHVHRPPEDIPGVGRFAVVSDPQGAGFMLFKGEGAPEPDLAPFTPGAIGWHELHTHDWEAAFRFYQDLFGWTKSQAVDLGPMGTYQTFSVGDAWTGGMVNNPEAQTPFWLYYFIVENIDAAAARIADAGGTLLRPPHQVPGGSWIVQAKDPQGTMFAVVGPRHEPVDATS